MPSAASLLTSATPLAARANVPYGMSATAVAWAVLEQVALPQLRIGLPVRGILQKDQRLVKEVPTWLLWQWRS